MIIPKIPKQIIPTLIANILNSVFLRCEKHKIIRVIIAKILTYLQDIPWKTKIKVWHLLSTPIIVKVHNNSYGREMKETKPNLFIPHSSSIKRKMPLIMLPSFWVLVQVKMPVNT